MEVNSLPVIPSLQPAACEHTTARMHTAAREVLKHTNMCFEALGSSNQRTWVSNQADLGILIEQILVLYRDAIPLYGHKQ